MLRSEGETLGIAELLYFLFASFFLLFVTLKMAGIPKIYIFLYCFLLLLDGYARTLPLRGVRRRYVDGRSAPLYIPVQYYATSRSNSLSVRTCDFPLCFTVLPFLDFFSFLLSGPRDPVFAG